MPLCTVVDLGPGHIVLDGAQLSPPERGTAAPPLFSPFLLWPNGRPSQLLLTLVHHDMESFIFIQVTVANNQFMLFLLFLLYYMYQ